MSTLPPAETYMKEVKYLPYGISLGLIVAYVSKHTPRSGTLVDLMCGPGVLLSQIQKHRPDLHLIGIDINEEFIAAARQNIGNRQYRNLEFYVDDVLTWQPPHQYDIVCCTAGLHHLPYERQKPFLERLPDMVTKNGFVVIADEFISDYSLELDRKLAAIELGVAYLRYVIFNGAPDDVIKATADLIPADVMNEGEYKTSLAKLLPILTGIFPDTDVIKSWPEQDTGYGDYLIIARKS